MLQATFSKEKVGASGVANPLYPRVDLALIYRPIPSAGKRSPDIPRRPPPGLGSTNWRAKAGTTNPRVSVGAIMDPLRPESLIVRGGYAV